jgi:hypothetical protein
VPPARRPTHVQAGDRANGTKVDSRVRSRRCAGHGGLLTWTMRCSAPCGAGSHQPERQHRDGRSASRIDSRVHPRSGRTFAPHSQPSRATPSWWSPGSPAWGSRPSPSTSCMRKGSAGTWSRFPPMPGSSCSPLSPAEPWPLRERWSPHHACHGRHTQGKQPNSCAHVSVQPASVDDHPRDYPLVGRPDVAQSPEARGRGCTRKGGDPGRTARRRLSQVVVALSAAARGCPIAGRIG